MAESQRDEIAKLESLYSANPEGRIFTHLAEAYRKAGDLDRARDTVERGLRKHADYSSAHVVLGRILLDQRDRRGAEQAFRRVLELDPENRVALRAVADLAREDGRGEEALGYYREILLLDPTDEAVEAIARDLEVEVGPAPAPGAGSPASPFEEGLGHDPGYGYGGGYDVGGPIHDPFATPTVAAGESESSGEGWVAFEPIDIAPGGASEGWLDLNATSLSLSPESADATPTGPTEPTEAGYAAAPFDGAGVGSAFEAGDAPGAADDADDADRDDRGAAGGLDAAYTPEDAESFAATFGSEAYEAEAYEAEAYEAEAYDTAPLEPEAFETMPVESEPVESGSVESGDGFGAGDDASPEWRFSATEAAFAYSEGDGAHADAAIDDVPPGEELVAGDAGAPGDVVIEAGEVEVGDAGSPAWFEAARIDGGIAATGFDGGNEAAGGEEAQRAAADEPPSVGAAGRGDDAFGPVVTETMAELYAGQGLYGRAAEVYRELLRGRPDDERLRAKLREAERGEEVAWGGDAPATGRPIGAYLRAVLGFVVSSGAATGGVRLGDESAELEGTIDEASDDAVLILDESMVVEESEEEDEFDRLFAGTGEEAPVEPSVEPTSPAAWDAEEAAAPEERGSSPVRSEAGGSGSETPGEDDDDLEMFRAWLQNLKR